METFTPLKAERKREATSSTRSKTFPSPPAAKPFSTTTVENILTRVTGGNISNIDGLIRANGTANLFLLNPNGIVFRENARLDVGGSFFATTANSLVFENGLEFSATSANAQPLLSVSVPLGLQFNQNPGAIRVQGTGHNFSFAVPGLALTPIIRGNGDSGLRVSPGQTLALVGGEVTLEGGTLRAEQGRIELGSVAEGRVGLSPTGLGWMLDYEGVPSFQDLRLSQRAAADVSGEGGGAIQMVGRQVTLGEGSVVLIQNIGLQPSGSIRINASESMEVLGLRPDATFQSSVYSQTLGTGRGGDIAISTRQLVVRDGAEIAARTLSPGQGGNIDLKVSESVEVLGVSPIDPRFISTISSNALGLGDGGNTTVSTARLSVRDGGLISSATFGLGTGGKLTVNATEFIEVIGGDLRTFPSSLTGQTVTVGDGGDLTIDTPRLVLQEGGQVTTSAFGSGQAGSITINATSSIEASGSLLPGFPAGVTSNAQPAPEILQQNLGLSGVVSGTSGDVTINTPVLSLTDGAQVTVANPGTGNAGSVQVNAGSIFLNDEGGITAATASGEGGNVILRADDSLQLRRASQITAEAGGTGNGGNLTLSADTIALLEGSTISANAFEGRGGNIQIATQGLFLSPDSNITASSQLGVDGIVTVTDPEVDTSSALVSLSDNPIDPTTQIVSTCAIAEENTFIVTGNGGLPADPTGILRGEDVWVDTRLSEDLEVAPIEASTSEAEDSSEEDSSIEPQPLVEATGWQRHENGTVELVVTPQGQLGNRWLERPVCRD